MMISEWLLKPKLLKNVNLKNRSVIELHCIILVMKLSTFNSLLVVRVERGVRWLS